MKVEDVSRISYDDLFGIDVVRPERVVTLHQPSRRDRALAALHGIGDALVMILMFTLAWTCLILAGLFAIRTVWP